MHSTPDRLALGAVIVVALALALTLGGCAGAVRETISVAGESAEKVEWNPQQYAGINRGTVRFPDGMEAEVVGGKEQGRIALAYKDKDREVLYEAENVKAFDGHAVRAAVEQSISADLRASAPGIVDSVVSAVFKALGM